MSKTFKKLSVVEKTTDFRKAVRIVEVPLVPPKDDQVLIRNIYAGVNATDINITAARYGTDGKLPFDIGLEAFGVVEAVGKNVTTIKVGQPVIHFAILTKAYAEYLCVKANQVFPVPSLKPEFIGALISGLTASIALDELGRIKAGDKVFITASAGGTGHIAVQWAKQKGCYVIGMTSSAEKGKLLKELGTDRIINYRTENLEEVLTKEFPSGVDVVYETIGGEVFRTLFKHLAPKGRLVIVGGIVGYQKDGFPDTPLKYLPTTLLMKNQTLCGFMLPQNQELFPKYLKQLTADILSAKLKIVIDWGNTTSEGPFEGIESVVRASDYLHSSKSIGKVVVKIQNP